MGVSGEKKSKSGFSKGKEISDTPVNDGTSPYPVEQ